MNEIVFDTENAKLNYSKSDSLLELIWKKNVTSEEFRRIYLSGVDFVIKNKVHYFLSDIRNEGLIPLDDVKWLTKEVIAKAFEIGIKKIALVNEDDIIFSSIYADSVKKKLENFSVKVQIFSDLSSGRSWLLTKS